MMRNEIDDIRNMLMDSLGSIDGHRLAPLYVARAYDLEPLPVYLRLNEDGEAGFWVSHSDGTPESVWHGRDHLWSLHPRLSADAVRKLAEDERVLSLLARAYSGLSVEWNGGNRVGYMSEDAIMAVHTLGQLLEREYNYDDSRLIPVVSAYDWVFGMTPSVDINGLRSVWPPDKTLDEAAGELRELAEQEGYIIDGDVAEELLDALEKLGDDNLDSLTGEHRRAYMELLV